MFFSYGEKRLDKKAMVNLKFITSQTGQQIITIQILPNISRSKDNKTMKFGQSIFPQINAENKLGRLAPDLSLFFKKLCIK